MKAAQDHDKEFRQKMLDALKNLLANLGKDKEAIGALTDALMKFSLEEIIKMINNTLDQDKPDAYLAKLFEKVLVGIEGSTPEMSTKFLKEFVKKEGIAVEELVPVLLEHITQEMAGETGKLMTATTKATFIDGTKEKLAEALAICLQDPRFKSAFDAANPGLFETLMNKELLNAMLNNIQQMADLDEAKQMVEGTGGEDQLKQLDANLTKLLDRLINDLDSILSDTLRKELAKFSKNIKEAHSMRANQDLVGIADTAVDLESSKEPGKGQGIIADTKPPKDIPIAPHMNSMNAEILMDSEIVKQLILAVNVDELLMKGVKHNTCDMKEIMQIKEELVNRYANINNPDFIISETDKCNDFLGKMDKFVDTLRAWGVNNDYCNSETADLSFRTKTIEDLLEQYKVDEEKTDNKRIKSDDLKVLVAFSATYETFILSKPV